MVQELQSHLEQEYVRLMIEGPDTTPNRNVADQQNPGNWYDTFKNHGRE